MRVVSVGELLWDVFADRELLGGAPLNFSANLQKLGDSAILITAVGNDIRGDRALDRMASLGLTTEFVQRVPAISTGTAEVSINSLGETTFSIPRPAAFDLLTLENATLQRMKEFRPDWLYFGTLLATSPNGERNICRLVEEAPSAHCFYDMNLRAGHWKMPLVERLSEMATIAKMNESEAQTLFKWMKPAASIFSSEEFCRDWSSKFNIDVVCITLGNAGCCIYSDSSISIVPSYPVSVIDTVGAGDAFAAAFLHGYGLSWTMPQIASFANALGALVASRAGATPDWSVEECFRLIAAGEDRQSSEPPMQERGANT